MARVLPGVLEVLAIFFPKRELINVLFPTFERPTMARDFVWPCSLSHSEICKVSMTLRRNLVCPFGIWFKI